MADIAYCLPAGIQFAQGSSIGFTRQGVDRSRGVGPFKSRGWQDFNLRQYSIEPIQFKHNGTLYEEFMAFWDQIADNGYIGYVMEPVSGTHRNLPCGPLADGVKTTFPIPAYNPSDVLIMVDGVIQSSGYTVHTCANVITSDDVASCSTVDTSYIRAAQATASLASHGAEGLKSVYALSADSGVPYVWNYLNTAPVTAAKAYTGVAAMKTEAASSINLALYAYDDTVATGNSTSPGTTTVGGAWYVLSLGYTMPASTDNLTIRAQESITYNDIHFYVDCLAVCPGDYDRWHLPSQAPGCVEFDTAPASGARITAVATGKRVTRCRFTGQPGWQYAEPGHIRMGRITATEIVEY